MRVLRPILIATLLIAASASALAQSVLEGLVSPGQLSARHQRLEAQCSSCHAPFNKVAQSGLCSSCHKPIAEDVRTGRGFHGRKARTKPCSACHTEHKGRNADIAAFSRTRFDHTQTDYPLAGAHLRVACASCHRAGVHFRSAPATCGACHGGAHDPHKGSLGNRCESCHIETEWKETRFNHDSTRFPLKGAHARATCKACHATPAFAATSMECVSCHRKDDAHGGRFGTACATCHDTQSWKVAKFDHARTGFALTGRHAAIACNACHQKAPETVHLSQQCASCHLKDDVHKGRNGSNCASCHGTAGWTTAKFDHDRMTSFPLRGRHSTLACVECHVRPATQVKLAGACDSCHRKDDPHAGQLGPRCAQCHGESTWLSDVRFDHDLVRFPLLGKHAQLACNACHANSRFKDAPVDCFACHRKDDRHQGAFGTGCGRCHAPSQWAVISFDHSTTDFPLTGAHTRASCEGCHKGGQNRASTVCGECHRRDDVHQGSFGLNCERCHSTDSFASVRSHF